MSKKIRIDEESLYSFIEDIVQRTLSAERAYNKQRQAEGIAEAQGKGVHFGRPRKELPSNFEELYIRFKNQEPLTSIAKDCAEMSISTLRTRLYDRLKQEGKNV